MPAASVGGGIRTSAWRRIVGIVRPVPAGLSDRLLEAICLLGPPDRCRERLAAYRAAGVGLPILYPPIGVEGARGVIRAFRR